MSLLLGEESREKRGESREKREESREKSEERRAEKENDGREKEERTREREKERRERGFSCVGSKRLRVYRQKRAHVLNTCARFARTHGGVLNLHTGGFPAQ